MREAGWCPTSRNFSTAVWLTVRLAHLDVAAVDRIIGDARSGAVTTAPRAGEVKAIRFRTFSPSSTFAVVLHAHAKARVVAVVGAVSLELHRVGSGGYRATLVADAAEEA